MFLGEYPPSKKPFFSVELGGLNEELDEFWLQWIVSPSCFPGWYSLCGLLSQFFASYGQILKKKMATSQFVHGLSPPFEHCYCRYPLKLVQVLGTHCRYPKDDQLLIFHVLYCTSLDLPTFGWVKTFFQKGVWKKGLAVKLTAKFHTIQYNTKTNFI